MESELPDWEKLRKALPGSEWPTFWRKRETRWLECAAGRWEKEGDATGGKKERGNAWVAKIRRISVN